MAHQLHCGTGCRSVGVFGRGSRDDRVRRGQTCRSGILAAEHLADVTWQDDRLGVHLTQQPGGEQPLHRPVGGCARGGIAGAAYRSSRRQPVEHLTRGLVKVVDRRCKTGRRAVGVLGDDLSREPGQRLGGLGAHPHLGITPHQRPIAQILESGLDIGPRRPTPDQIRYLTGGHRRAVCPEHQQRIQHGQAQKIQLVGGGFHRVSGGCPGGQRRDAARRRLGQVGPQFQKADQFLVGQTRQPRAQRDAPVLGHY